MENNFRYNLSRIAKIGSIKNLSIEEISYKVDLDIDVVDFLLNYFSNLNEEEVELVELFATNLSISTLKFICLQKEEFRSFLIENSQIINESENSFKKIVELIASLKEPEPLERIEKKFLSSVANYITERGRFEPPFTKKFVGFLKKIGSLKIDELSPRQLSWLKDVIREDCKREPFNRYFDNSFLRSKGFEISCEIIKKIANESQQSI